MGPSEFSQEIHLIFAGAMMSFATEATSTATPSDQLAGLRLPFLCDGRPVSREQLAFSLRNGHEPRRRPERGALDGSCSGEDQTGPKAVAAGSAVRHEDRAPGGTLSRWRPTNTCAWPASIPSKNAARSRSRSIPCCAALRAAASACAVASRCSRREGPPACLPRAAAAVVVAASADTEAVLVLRCRAIRR